MGLLNNILGRNKQKSQASALPPLPPIGGGAQSSMPESTPPMMNSFNPQTSITPEELSSSDNQFLQSSTVGITPALGQSSGTNPVAPPIPLNDLNKPPVSDLDSVIGSTPLNSNEQNQYNKDWYKASDDASNVMSGSAPVSVPIADESSGSQATQNLLQTPAGEIKEIVGPPMGNANNTIEAQPIPDKSIQNLVQSVSEESVGAGSLSSNVIDNQNTQDLVTGTAVESIAEEISTQQSDVINPLPPIVEPVNQVVSEALDPTPLNPIDLSETISTPEVSEPQVNAMPEVLPAMVSETQKIETITKPKLKRTFFNVIGMLGLNGPAVDPNLSSEVSKIINHFSQNKIKAIFDSKNGLGQSVINEINKTGLWNEGVYFMPFMSGLSGSIIGKLDPNSKVNSVIYSNLFERLSYIVSNSKLFIVFNSGGVNNLSQLAMVWTLSYLYQGQNKPVILFGSNWSDALNSLKTFFRISDSEMEALYIVSNFEELAQKLAELEDKYKSQIKPQYRGRVLDRRVEGDEGQFILK